MKKIYLFLTILLSFFTFNISVFAYSDEVILGGQNIGININYDGVMIVGFYKIDGRYNKNNLLLGDIITKVNDKKIKDIDNMLDLINKEIKNNKVQFTINRNNDIKTLDFYLIEDDKTYKTGLYVKDSISGIGTLTYIDPKSFIYGALGHEVVDGKANVKVEVKNGNIFATKVTGIEKSTNGTPGGKSAKFFMDNVFGTINKNTISGIFGNFSDLREFNETIEVGKKEDIKIGSATIRTVLKDNMISEYPISITKIDESHNTKNIYFQIDDKGFLDITGGIVQGMSGSPIIQDNKLIGAITHVVVDNPQKGYGIFITTMLEEGER